MDEPQTKEGEATAAEAAAPAAPEAPAGGQAPRGGARPRSALAIVALLLALAAAGLAALQWYDARRRIAATQEELASRLRDISAVANEARHTASAAQETAREAQTKAKALEAQLAQSQSEQAALRSMYQDLSRTRDEWELTEIEQVLHIAQQQLELLGNVHAALLALQLADARLARGDRLQFLPIRRALAHDIELLKSYPALDVPGMAVELDGLAQRVDALPLAFDERMPRPAASTAPQGARGYLARFGAELWGELRQLLIVRRTAHPAPPLLPPPQAYFLRQNLKLELLNARLSLLLHDQQGYRQALRNAHNWIERYFDVHAKPTAAVLAQIKQLAAVSLDVKLPSIADSLDAVRRYKAQQESGAQ